MPISTSILLLTQNLIEKALLDLLEYDRAFQLVENSQKYLPEL